MDKETADLESQLMALLVEQVQAEHTQLITALTDDAASAALERLVRELAAEEWRIHRAGMWS